MKSNRVLNIIFDDEDIGVQNIDEKLIIPYKKDIFNPLSELNIFFSHIKINSIDEVLYSYLLLISKRENLSKINIEFKCVEEYNKPYQISISFKKFLKNEGIVINIENSNFKHSENKSFSYVSDDFTPIIHIDKNSYKKLFYLNENESQLTLLDKFLQKLNKENKLKNIINLISNKKDFYNSIKENLDTSSSLKIPWHYYFKSLDFLNITRFLFVERCNKLNFTTEMEMVGAYKLFSFNSENSKKIYDEVLKTLKQYNFFEFNYIQLYFFYLSINNSEQLKINKYCDYSNRKQRGEGGVKLELIGNSLIDVFIQKYCKHIANQINLIKNLNLTLNELSKNIIEHSSNIKGEGIGAINGRIFTHNKLSKLNKNINFNEWLSGKNENEYFFKINVIDIGLNDIKKTYLDNLQENINTLSTHKSIYKDDIIKDFRSDLNLIKDNDYNLSYFINYNRISLNHQLRRVASRLGLLLFSKTVIKDKLGLTISATNNIESNIKNSSMSFLKKNDYQSKEVGIPSFSLGTNYSFYLPLYLDFAEENEGDTSDQKFEMGVSTSIFKPLFNYKFGNKETNFKGKVPLLEINLSKCNINSDDKYGKIFDLTQFINNEIKELKSENSPILVLKVNNKLNDIITNSSDWFRFLAEIQINTTIKRNLIIINMDKTQYEEFIGVNKLIGEVNYFWTKENSILFYFKILFDNRTHWFNSILTCEKYIEYEKLNYDISHYHYNISQFKDDLLIDNFKNIKDYNNSNSPFFENGKLLNFELLLTMESNLTLFEETVQSLLNKEIL